MITALQAVEGYNALLGIENKPLSFECALTVCKAIEELQPIVSAYSSAESQIIDNYAVKKEDGMPDIENGRFTIEPSKAYEYAKNRRILDEKPIDWEKKNLFGINGLKFTPKQLSSLSTLFNLEGV